MAEISIVVPVFNEQENIRLLTDSLKKALVPLNTSYEIIFVDDCSTDQSLQIIKDLAGSDTHIKYLTFTRNFGQQAALTAGLDFASGKAVITMDADMQDPPELLPEMICEWEKGHDIVYMHRKNRHDGLFKKLSARFYYFLLSKFSDRKISSNIGDFRLMDQKVVNELKKLHEKSRYIRGMVSWMGFSHTILDYDRPNRSNGKSGFSLLKMVRLGMHGILNFSLLPLRLGLVVGVAVIILGFLLLAYIVLDTLMNDVYYELHKWLGVVTFIFTGFLFVLIWILGEYIGKIYDEVKNRPVYIIREKGNLE
jgi:dolichol-phosphate mannosyltransferase